MKLVFISVDCLSVQWDVFRAVMAPTTNRRSFVTYNWNSHATAHIPDIRIASPATARGRRVATLFACLAGPAAKTNLAMKSPLFLSSRNNALLKRCAHFLGAAADAPPSKFPWGCFGYMRKNSKGGAKWVLF